MPKSKGTRIQYKKEMSQRLTFYERKIMLRLELRTTDQRSTTHLCWRSGCQFLLTFFSSVILDAAQFFRRRDAPEMLKIHLKGTQLRRIPKLLVRFFFAGQKKCGRSSPYDQQNLQSTQTHWH
ncbi:hypothetical protein BT96DRAFT_926586 [Gymnopus androsaceus JB14]|uniref:Uncharacterized protein n=1 Tax=Gymnopus androsaceus JB14 TaxID=1447944 RepID=A0A6A4GUI1_9AGAR|nr:hypothetical protein BT96DRAFT_926586 [Gymnopus androsaceus JB14]